MIQNHPRGPTDRILVLEALLALLLVALFLGLYFVPAGEPMFEPEWWAWPVLGGLFFGILLLDQWRRKRRARSGLSNALPDAEVTPPEELP